MYKWIPVNLMLGVTYDGLASYPGGIEIFLVVSCYRNRDKFRLDGPHGSYADLYENCRSVTYSRDRENEVSKIFIISLAFCMATKTNF